MTMLNQRDFELIEKLLDERFEESFRNFPTKDELFGKMDEVMGELKTIREELAATNSRLIDHEERIDCLEKIHPKGRHAVA